MELSAAAAQWTEGGGELGGLGWGGGRLGQGGQEVLVGGHLSKQKEEFLK